MRVIVDTSILVSAIIRDNLPEQVIILIISQPTIEWIATAEIVKEYKAVLLYLCTKSLFCQGT
jgi:predicted nucleic acid-binding protein